MSSNPWSAIHLRMWREQGLPCPFDGSKMSYIYDLEADSWYCEECGCTVRRPFSGLEAGSRVLQGSVSGREQAPDGTTQGPEKD